MSTATVSTRLTKEEVERLDLLSQCLGSDRANLLKSVVRRGLAELWLEHAVAAFRREEISLSRAAELAGLDTWEFLSRMDDEDLSLHYDMAEFREDLISLAKK